MKYDQQNAKDYAVLTSPIVDKSPEVLSSFLKINVTQRKHGKNLMGMKFP